MNKSPAISNEIDFIARHDVIAGEILEAGKGPLFELTKTVWERTQQDVDKLLRELEAELSYASKSVFRVGWANTNRGQNWHSWGRLFKPMGPKKRIATIGFYLDNEPMPLRLIGWMWPRWGGLDGRRELVRVCNKKIGGVRLITDHPDRYPGWSEDDAIVWLEDIVSLKTNLSQLTLSVRKRARKFLKTAKPILSKLAHG